MQYWLYSFLQIFIKYLHTPVVTLLLVHPNIKPVPREALTGCKMTTWVLSALLLGPLSHYLFFVRGEHHLQAPLYFQALLLLLVLCFMPLSKKFLDHQIGLQQPVIILLSYLTSLFSSITTYRLFLHPTRHYPGPRLAATSKLWHTWLARDSQNHRVLDKWYEKYGEFVRSGKLQMNSSHTLDTCLLS